MSVLADAGLHRQSELTIKEPFRVMFDQQGKYLEVIGLGESFQAVEPEAEENAVREV
jgi:hypothetical protein